MEEAHPVISVADLWQLEAFEGFAQYADKLGAISRGEFPLNAHPTAYVNALLVKAGPGTLYGFSVYNSKVAAQFIQLFDAASLSGLATGAIPEAVYSVATVTDREFTFGTVGRRFWRGIVIANSTTGPTYTAGAADCWIDAQYV